MDSSARSSRNRGLFGVDNGHSANLLGVVPEVLPKGIPLTLTSDHHRAHSTHTQQKSEQSIFTLHRCVKPNAPICNCTIRGARLPLQKLGKLR